MLPGCLASEVPRSLQEEVRSCLGFVRLREYLEGHGDLVGRLIIRITRIES